jgi:hypothetical protein
MTQAQSRSLSLGWLSYTKDVQQQQRPERLKKQLSKEITVRCSTGKVFHTRTDGIVRTIILLVVAVAGLSSTNRHTRASTHCYDAASTAR